MDDLPVEPLPASKTYLLRLPEDYPDPCEEDIARWQTRWTALVPDSTLVVLPSGADLLSAYVFTEKMGGYTRTVHFATHAELLAYIAAIDSKRPEVKP